MPRPVVPIRREPFDCSDALSMALWYGKIKWARWLTAKFLPIFTPCVCR